MFDLLPLIIPAAAAMLALPFGLRTRPEEKTIRAVYLFHRSGDPLVTIASEDVPPFEAAQLGPVLGAVREFVEAEDPSGRGMDHRSLRFGEEGLVAVRGQYLSACAVFRGNGDGMLRRELVRFVREFESQHEGNLDTWEQATGIAGAASSAIAGMVSGSFASVV